MHTDVAAGTTICKVLLLVAATAQAAIDHLQVVMHALLCESIELQLAEKGLRGVKRDALPLQVIQPKKFLQHLLWCCKCEVCQPIALHHAPKGDDAPGALPEDKTRTIIDAEQVFRRGHRRDPLEAELVCCIPLYMRDTVDTTDTRTKYGHHCRSPVL